MAYTKRLKDQSNRRPRTSSPKGIIPVHAEPNAYEIPQSPVPTGEPSRDLPAAPAPRRIAKNHSGWRSRSLGPATTDRALVEVSADDHLNACLQTWRSRQSEQSLTEQIGGIENHSRGKALRELFTGESLDALTDVLLAGTTGDSVTEERADRPEALADGPPQPLQEIAGLPCDMPASDLGPKASGASM